MSVQAALRAAIHDALLADTGLCAALGGANKVYDATPVAVELPYVRIGDVTSDDEVHWLALHAFSGDSREQAHVIAGALLQALDDAPLALEGHRLINLRFSVANIHRDVVGHSYRSLIRFVASTEELK
jgi:hypothetical protein